MASKGRVYFSRAKSIMASRAGYAEAKAFLFEVQVTLFKAVELVALGAA